MQRGLVTVDIINQKRRQKTLRKKLYHQRKKERLQDTIHQEETTSAFKTPQSMGKVVKKIKSILIKCPDKKRRFKKMFLAEFPKFSSMLENSDKKARPWNKLESNVIERVKRIYNRDDISRHTSGKRYVAVKNDTGEKEKIQKRHMTITVKEAYHLFVSENPEININKVLRIAV
ncbi:unnamed protein product [Brassicogethes aeneus]|uniref:Uncharacterized protein n=1 Tax=Brassicogethes aeneus TaxID=1431903 RepID=A0A9P0FNR4_BRAAE|nr:unnamed protein product [Brassicogethes aeneus]